ncbi:hypothetical protein HZS_1398, partial [Henneguya salminicola]
MRKVTIQSKLFQSFTKAEDKGRIILQKKKCIQIYAVRILIDHLENSVKYLPNLKGRLSLVYKMG